MTPSSSSAGSTDVENPSISPPQTDPPAPGQEDPVAAAEKVKEQGNVAFKAGRYGMAIDLYTEAISKHTTVLIALNSIKLQSSIPPNQPT